MNVAPTAPKIYIMDVLTAAQRKLQYDGRAIRREENAKENAKKSKNGNRKAEKMNEIKNDNSEDDSEDEENGNYDSSNESDEEQDMTTINKKMENIKAFVQKNLKKGATPQDILTTPQEMLLK